MHAFRRTLAAKTYNLATLSVVAAATSLFLTSSLIAAPRIEIIPSTFDFGWTPDNAKVTADFVVRNTGQDTVPLTEVLPACGCTTSEFNPTNVGSRDETKISLTFNTRGYTNAHFRKPARVKIEGDENDYVATLEGRVTDPKGTLVPDGDGIAGFEPNASTKKKTVGIYNKTGKPVVLKVVQPAARWADVEVPAKTYQPGEKIEIGISVDGSTKDVRTTSVTLAPEDNPDRDRVTIAIRTGAGPSPYRIAPNQKPKVEAPKPSPKPAKATTAPAPKSGK